MWWGGVSSAGTRGQEMPSEHMSPETHLAQQALAVSQPTAISVWLRCRAVPVVMHWGGGVVGVQEACEQVQEWSHDPSNPTAPVLLWTGPR